MKERHLKDLFLKAIPYGLEELTATENNVPDPSSKKKNKGIEVPGKTSWIFQEILIIAAEGCIAIWHAAYPTTYTTDMKVAATIKKPDTVLPKPSIDTDVNWKEFESHRIGFQLL
ncbi:hypothetical protein FQA39_LY18797 [Lamprigera yunnana]|nr:hypothetical protein FQA39_LY18797 [Lamprigera yunnana]